MKRAAEDLFNSNSDFPDFEKRLSELACLKKGETIPIEKVITDVWKMILNGLPYVMPDRTGEYLLSQARDFKKLINKGEILFSRDRIRKLFDMDITLKDQALEAKNGFILPHNRNVSRYARAVCKSLGYRPETIDQIAFSGELHDIGKRGIPDYILNKPGKLTPEEFERVKPHPIIGREILELISNLFDVSLDRTIQEVEHHHEKYYGGGYPYNKQAEDIPLGAQIISICDVFDAITSHRPYSGPVDPQKAIEEMRRNEFGSFNPELLEHSLRPLASTYLEVHKN